jgi:hypothetical protein
MINICFSKTRYLTHTCDKGTGWATCLIFFFNLCCGILGTAANTGLFYQPRIKVMVIVEKLVEWRLAGETEVLGENLLQRHFVHHKSHMPRPGFEPGPPRWEASD